MEKQNALASYALIPFLLIFIVGTANFYNFMDGINGIAGITGVIGFGMLAFYASNFTNNLHLSALAICMSISCIGFLPFNIPRASVFMGDVGSILLGFVFSSMAVYLSKDMIDLICLASFLFPFYADELTTMVVRLKKGESLTKAHRSHLYQILANEWGISHLKISAGYGLVQLMIGISTLWVKHIGTIMVVSVLLFYACLFAICTFIFRKKTAYLKF